MYSINSYKRLVVDSKEYVLVNIEFNYTNSPFNYYFNKDKYQNTVQLDVKDKVLYLPFDINYPIEHTFPTY